MKQLDFNFFMQESIANRTHYKVNMLDSLYDTRHGQPLKKMSKKQLLKYVTKMDKDSQELYQSFVAANKKIIKLEKTMERCSYCNKKDPTVDRNKFDGMCADCTNLALNSETVADTAKKNNERLKREENIVQ